MVNDLNIRNVKKRYKARAKKKKPILSTELVAILRDVSGASMMSAKKALTLAKGDLDLARGILIYDGCAINVPNYPDWIMRQAKAWVASLILYEVSIFSSVTDKEYNRIIGFPNREVVSNWAVSQAERYFKDYPATIDIKVRHDPFSA